jgi:ABC-2 type transport system ATP-binding protein
MPDQPGLYQDMRVREFLEFFADAFLIPRSRQRAVVELQIERAGLASRAESFVEELSFGMKQRLFLAKTLLHDPAVLLLDEPATGLDPLARVDLRRQLKDLHSAGITILISSHILSDLEDICSRVAFIAEGKNAADASGSTIMDVRRADAQLAHYELELLGDVDSAARMAAGIPGVRVLDVRPPRLLVEIAGDDSAAADFLREVAARGVRVVSFAHPAAQLEDRYRQVFGAKPQ